MRKVFSFLVVMMFCAVSFADDGSLRIVEKRLQSATDDTTDILVPTSTTIYTKSLPNKSSKEVSYIFTVTSDGTVDTVVTKQYKPTGGDWVDFNIVASIVATQDTVASVDTLEAFSDNRLKLVGGATQNANTVLKIWEGRR